MSEFFKSPDFNNFKEMNTLNDFAKKLQNYFGYFLIAFIIFSIFSGAIVRVGAGERAVVFNIVSGVEERVLGEGINILIPIIERATIYDVKESTYSFVSEDKNSQGPVIGDEIHTLTADGQRVDVELSIRLKPIPSELWKLHREIGPDYITKIILPKARTVLREVLAQYPVEDVYSIKRQEIQNKVQENLRNDLLKDYFIDLQEVLIRNVRFSKEFQDAIDRKQQAYQEFLKMEYILEAEKTKRDSKILQAEGEAKAINLRVGALRANPDFIKYKKSQVYGKRAKLVLTD